MANHPWVDTLRLRTRDFRNDVVRLLPADAEIGHIYQTPDGLFCVPSRDMFISSVLRKGKTWGSDEIERIRSVLSPDARVLFVGGHVGTLAIPISRSAAHVTVIEANPETYRYLAANCALNGVTNIDLVQIAAGEAEGTIEFVSNNKNTGGSKRKPLVDDPRYFYDNPDILTVPMARLDDVLGSNYSTIVMDIEGSEYFALKGMPERLQHAEHLFVEFLPHHLDNVSGVTVSEFRDAVGAGFDHMYVPTENASFHGPEILPKLEAIYKAGIGEDALLFSKRPIRFN